MSALAAHEKQIYRMQVEKAELESAAQIYLTSAIRLAELAKKGTKTQVIEEHR